MSDEPHAVTIKGTVDLSIHAFENGERKHIEQDGDVFNIDGTDVSLVVHRE